MRYRQNFMIWVFAVAFLAAGLVSTSFASAHDVGAQINEMNVKWVEAFKQRDFAAIEALYTSNGLLLPSNSPPVEGPKGLRHGSGVAAVQAGIPLNMVQTWLGHAQLSTTAIYADAVGAEKHWIMENVGQLEQAYGVVTRRGGWSRCA